MKRVCFETNGQVAYLGEAERPLGLSREVNGPWQSHPNDVARDAANSDIPVTADADVGVHATTRLQTPNGPKPVSDLRIGDHVFDHTGEVSRITTISRAAQTTSAIVLRAPYFGLDQDLICGRNQAILLDTDIVEAMLDKDAVLMPAWALKDGQRAVYRELTPRDALFEIKLDSGNAPRVGECSIAPKPRAGSEPLAHRVNDAEARSLSAGYRSGYFAN